MTRTRPLPDAPSVPPARPVDRADPGAQPDWATLVPAVLAEPERVRLVFQPIVGLAEAVVVGYEALSRFAGPPGLTPDRWFAAADRLGLGAELEAVVVARCLALRDSLPADCFLTVNVSPHLLTQSVLADLLLAAGDLHPIVLELTEHQEAADVRPLVDLRNRLADHGALLALDDAGSGYSGLQQMTQLRPHLISWTGRWSQTPTGTRSSWRWPSCSASSPGGSTPGCSPRGWRRGASSTPSCGWASRWRRATCSVGRHRRGRGWTTRRRHACASARPGRGSPRTSPA